MEKAQDQRPAGRRWPILRSFAGWRRAGLRPDFIAGLTLAAIAIPEQMATARLAGFAPQTGLLAIIAGALGFAVVGSSRVMSVGADSTIAPIFAGGLALLAAAGSPQYASLAAALALMVGLVLIAAGLFRLGWVADLLSIPVTTGFLTGIAGHIVLSQAPALLGLAPPHGSFVDQAETLMGALRSTNILTLAIGVGVLAVMLGSERVDPRIPGALIGVGAAAAAVAAFGLEGHGVSTLGDVSGAAPALRMPAASLDDLTRIAPLALIVAIVVMVQTAATSRAFVPDGEDSADVDGDFVGVGAASALAGLVGAFPLDASPPRTAAGCATGGRSQAGSLVCAVGVLALLTFGAGLLADVPHAALAGVLLFVARRIVRVAVFADVWRRSSAEFALIVATAAAILFLPIQQGVAAGIVLSLLHGVWTTTRSQIVELARISGTSIWWPRTGADEGETAPGTIVAAWQAPLSFLNVDHFRRAGPARVAARAPVRLLGIEANSLVAIDYTAAQGLAGVIRRLRGQGTEVAFARLESVRAQQGFARFGLDRLIGPDHLFASVEEAIRALAPEEPAGRRAPVTPPSLSGASVDRAGSPAGRGAKP